MGRFNRYFFVKVFLVPRGAVIVSTYINPIFFYLLNFIQQYITKTNKLAKINKKQQRNYKSNIHSYCEVIHKFLL